MKVKVKQDACISCGACVSTCPEVFDFNEEGFAEAIVDKVEIDDEPKVKDAMEGCPTEAIVEVTEEEKAA